MDRKQVDVMGFTYDTAYPVNSVCVEHRNSCICTGDIDTRKESEKTTEFKLKYLKLFALKDECKLSLRLN